MLGNIFRADLRSFILVWVVSPLRYDTLRARCSFYMESSDFIIKHKFKLISKSIIKWGIRRTFDSNAKFDKFIIAMWFRDWLVRLNVLRLRALMYF